jgi:hypothetical protein
VAGIPGGFSRREMGSCIVDYYCEQEVSTMRSTEIVSTLLCAR